MTTQTVQSAGTGTMPRVNLMPPEIAQAARFRQVQVGLGAAVLAAVAVAGLLYVHEHSGVAAAKDELAAAQQTNASLQTKLASLNAVKETFAAVQARQAMLTTAMGSEVRWSFILNDLSFRMPSNVWLTNLSVSPTSTTAAPPAAPATLGSSAAPAAVVPIATITFSGIGFKHDDVAAWLDSMAKEKSFSDPTFGNSTESTVGTHPVVDFSSTVIVTSVAESGRYAAQTTAESATPTGTTP
ncbi:MAG TPA: PilN domain-containing protein [Mycobacteriales bacterium]|nr:PilN domain-containing protein [Mycobacteriales bacterium]